MPELHQMFNRHRKYIFYLLSIYVLGWGFTSYKSIFLGLVLGTCLSLFNHWLMVRRTVKFGDAVLEGKKVRSLGTAARMASAVLGVMIVLRYPELFHLLGFIFGLMTAYLVIMIDYFFHYVKSNK
ncbi:ATP synthase subunit I [Falsibacillus albus]|uniref:ATP synthase subunit I n=1 Tax=Falsibacillus albus TaxID=2478915 RepID=A0A3L7JT48_9BACI|nr:ATP synthase subunit I [Falsibacillus albus]RLQ93514.1 ATP synthase subunit I [Falsibacillus albus]